MSSPRPLHLDEGARTRRFTLKLDEFGCHALAHESARLGVAEDELVRFALLYYLADIDSGRTARKIPTGSSPEPAPRPRIT